MTPPPPDAPLCKLVPVFTPNHGRWMFALLCQLDEQLSGDDISVLRTLAREVLRLIKEERTHRKEGSADVRINISGGSLWLFD